MPEKATRSEALALINNLSDSQKDTAHYLIGLAMKNKEFSVPPAWMPWWRAFTHNEKRIITWLAQEAIIYQETHG